MESSILAPWRDLAIILLGIELVVIVAVPGIVFYFSLKGVRALKRRIRPPLLTAQVWALRVEQGTNRVADAVAGVPIGVASTTTRWTVTARGVVGYLLGR